MCFQSAVWGLPFMSSFYFHPPEIAWKGQVVTSQSFLLNMKYACQTIWRSTVFAELIKRLWGLSFSGFIRPSVIKICTYNNTKFK